MAVVLTAAFENRTDWLFDKALPFWFSAGTDWAQGGFHERFEQDGSLVPEIPRRTRVVARQIYVFMAAGRMGWPGDWRRAVSHGAEALFDHCIQPDNLVLSTYWPGGQPANAAFDFYDHAFALFALGELARLPEFNARALTAADAILDAMERRFRHPAAGFLEDDASALPLRANPHMHLLEACLVLASAPKASPRWQICADAIVELACRSFVDPATGGLREFFASDWSPMPDDSGRLIEPGHQFEWSWLLHQWNADRHDDAVAVIADRLYAIGESHGLGADKAIVIDELWDDFTVRTATARNWPVTERIKACVEQASQSAEPARFEQRAADALNGLGRYFRTTTPGLWHDRLDRDLVPIAGSCAASSLYHIVCALETVHHYLSSAENPL